MNSILAVAMTESNITNAIVWICVMGLIFYLLYWLIGKLAPPEPWNKIGYAILAIAAVLICIKILLRFAGSPF